MYRNKRNDSRRYRRDASGNREFKQFWKEFEDLLDLVTEKVYEWRSEDPSGAGDVECIIEIADRDVTIELIGGLGVTTLLLEEIVVPSLQVDIFYEQADDYRKKLGGSMLMQRGILSLTYDDEDIEDYLGSQSFRDILETLFSQAIL